MVPPTSSRFFLTDLISSSISIEYFFLALISFALSVPAAWLLMSDWLQNYEYRTALNPIVFLWTILLILLPTMLTVSFLSYNAATANPSESIRMD